MTPAQLRARLVTLLADQLGAYKPPGTTQTFPAIYVGEPPSDWVVNGLEVLIEEDPDQHNTPLQGGEFNLAETLTVRLVKHGSADPARAVRRIVSHYPGSTVTRVPADEELGILDRRTVLIPK